MATSRGGVFDLAIADTPIAVLDFETTGLDPRSGDRVVEVAVVRIEPGAKPLLVLDTLIDPQTPVRASSIHGIYDHDVLGAPLFSEIAGPIAHAVKGAVVAIFNSSFDTRFLEAETRRSRKIASFTAPPQLCMMYLRPALGLGKRMSLEFALRNERLPIPDHRAAHDALATALLWERYRQRALEAGLLRFGDIADRKRYKFMESWHALPLDDAAAHAVGPVDTKTALMSRMTPLDYPRGSAPMSDASSPRSRAPSETPASPFAPRRAAYLHALVDALSDARLEPSETDELLELQHELGITPGEIRAVHAAFYADVVRVCVEDSFVSHQEATNLAGLGDALRALGWAPGDITARRV